MSRAKSKCLFASRHRVYFQEPIDVPIDHIKLTEILCHDLIQRPTSTVAAYLVTSSEMISSRGPFLLQQHHMLCRLRVCPHSFCKRNAVRDCEAFWKGRSKVRLQQGEHWQAPGLAPRKTEAACTSCRIDPYTPHATPLARHSIHD
eukprot:6198288-Amphidinium_carterae.1